MRVTVNQSILSNALGKVQSAVSSKTTLAILNNILVEAKDGHLTLTATDLEQSISTTLPVNVQAEGTTTIPAKKFVSIVRQLANEDLTLEIDDNDVASIKCGHSFYKIQGIDATAYPTEEAIEESRELTLNNILLKKMLNKISYSISSDETRHVLNGILLTVREGTLTAVATDGRRLALMETIIEADSSLDGDTILPAKAVNELQKLLMVDGEVQVSLGEARAEFTVGDTRLRTKILEGNFPNFRQVIPANFSQEVAIPREKLSVALQRVSVILSDSSAAIKLSMEPTELVVSAHSNTDESTEIIEMAYENEPIAISFNPQFISDPLKKLECDDIVIKFNDKISPIGVFGDEGFLYVIMPMRN